MHAADRQLKISGRINADLKMSCFEWRMERTLAEPKRHEAEFAAEYAAE